MTRSGWGTAAKSLLKTNLIEENDQDIGLNGKVFKLGIGRDSIETFKLKF